MKKLEFSCPPARPSMALSLALLCSANASLAQPKTVAKTVTKKAAPTPASDVAALKKMVLQQAQTIQKLSTRVEQLEKDNQEMKQKASESVPAAPAAPSPASPEPVTPPAPPAPPKAVPAPAAPPPPAENPNEEPPIPDVQLPREAPASGEKPAPANPANPSPSPNEPPVPDVALPGDQPAPSPTPATGPQEPPVPDVALPGDTGTANEAPTPGPASQAPVAGSTGASYIPDLSVIGNNIGRFISVKGDHDRNRFQLGEFEIGLQQPVYEGIRFDAFLSADAGDDFKLGAEEAYATFSNVAGLPFGAYLGKKRLDFGKINPVHPHARLYIDQPAVLDHFLGPDGVDGNGASVNYLLPFKKVFTNLELGMWKVSPGEEGINLGSITNTNFYPVGLGVNNNFPLGRLWMSKALGSGGSELELGMSDGFGKGDNGDNINLAGVDFTYRNFPGTFKRLMLQGEAMWHRRDDRFGGTGEHMRAGQYLLFSYRPDQYKEYGIRLDNAQYPWPLPGRERSASLIWSNHLSEGTLVRFQYKYGSRTDDVLLPASHGYNEALLQFVWAAGSHTHPLQ